MLRLITYPRSSYPLFDCLLRSTAMPASPYPILSDDKSDASLSLPEIFSNNAADSNSSTVPSDFDDSSESKSDDESEDKLTLEDKEE